MTDYSDLVSWLRISAAGSLDPHVGQAAHAIEAQASEIDYWKNRTREALETIKDNVERIAELEQKLHTAEWFWKEAKEQHRLCWESFEAQEKEIVELKDEIETRILDASTAWDLCDTRDTRIAELEAALKPFADYAEQEPDDVSDDDHTVIEWVSVRDLRQARKVLGEKE